MNNFADAGKTNPIKPNFKGKKCCCILRRRNRSCKDIQLGREFTERYEYDAYGHCYVLEPNFAPDPDGKSNYGNPYFFTGRRLDILDNNSLKIQYNRRGSPNAFFRVWGSK